MVLLAAPTGARHQVPVLVTKNAGFFAEKFGM
jgi:hypothetical protein